MTVRTEVVTAEAGITVQQAAEAYGVSEKTIRRRIKSGELSAYQVPTAQGHEWRITAAAPADAPRVVDQDGAEADGEPVTNLARPDGQPALLRALEIIREQQERIRELEDRNERLVGEAAYQRGRSEGYQRDIAEAKQQLQALAAPEGAQQTPKSLWFRLRSKLIAGR